MANESRVFRLPAGMSTQVVANAVEAFLSSAKGMEVQSAETTEGYVVQGRQEKDGWKTIAGMRMATTMQMIRMDDNLNVTVGQGEWSDMNKYDKMIACNRKASAEKIDLARRTIFEMVEEGEKVTIPKLIAKTGLSRGFFYKNPMVRQALDKALEQQVGMIDPRRSVLDMAMDNEIVALHERIRELQQENQRLRAENEKMQKALSRRNDKLLRNL